MINPRFSSHLYLESLLQTHKHHQSGKSNYNSSLLHHQYQYLLQLDLAILNYRQLQHHLLSLKIQILDLELDRHRLLSYRCILLENLVKTQSLFHYNPLSHNKPHHPPVNTRLHIHKSLYSYQLDLMNHIVQYLMALVLGHLEFHLHSGD